MLCTGVGGGAGKHRLPITDDANDTEGRNKSLEIRQRDNFTKGLGGGNGRTLLEMLSS